MRLTCLLSGVGVRRLGMKKQGQHKENFRFEDFVLLLMGMWTKRNPVCKLSEQHALACCEFLHTGLNHDFVNMPIYSNQKFSKEILVVPALFFYSQATEPHPT